MLPLKHGDWVDDVKSEDRRNPGIHSSTCRPGNGFNEGETNEKRSLGLNHCRFGAHPDG
jgi:hypothetical protein